MGNVKVATRLRKIAACLNGATPPSQPTRELHEVLWRERSRSDRTDSEFSMLKLWPCGKDNQGRRTTPDDAALSKLLKVLQKRSRTIDDIGWSGNRDIWFVMPNCSAESASKVAEEIDQILTPEGLVLVHEVYHYSPGATAWFDQDDPSQGPGRDGPNDPESNAGNGDGGQTRPICDGQVVKPIRELLMGKMPLWKRCLDMLGATVGLAVMGILMLPIAIAIKATSTGPVFFRQKRSGRGGKPFVLVKLRTMVADAESRQAELLDLNEQDGPAFKMEDDPRVTPVGRFLRNTSLDELPQLWNILLGQMSLVGPRPLPCTETVECQSWQLQRLDATPGLTCFWQIEDRRSKIAFDDWVRMDVGYIRSQSLILDLKLIFRTVARVLFKIG